jgi:hypothetical protein
LEDYITEKKGQLLEDHITKKLAVGGHTKTDGKLLMAILAE